MIELISLEKKFENKIALGPVDLTFEKGKVYGLLGSNGCGKSTLLRTISGIYDRDFGIAKVDGEDIFENIGYKNKLFLVSDQPYFFKQSTITEMADFYKSIYPNWNEEVYTKLCSVFKLDLNAKIQTFSKGMQRQALIILGFSTMPEYLFLDEAFDGLDPVMRNVLKVLITERISDENICVIITSHNINEFEDLCDIIISMHKGKVVTIKDRNNIEGIVKVQLAFDRQVSKEDFENAEIEILSYEVTGKLINLTIRGNKSDVETKLDVLNPLFMNIVPLSLEEIFVYEMRGVGYDASDII